MSLILWNAPGVSEVPSHGNGVILHSRLFTLVFYSGTGQSICFHQGYDRLPNSGQKSQPFRIMHYVMLIVSCVRTFDLQDSHYLLSCAKSTPARASVASSSSLKRDGEKKNHPIWQKLRKDVEYWIAERNMVPSTAGWNELVLQRDWLGWAEES